MDDLHARLGGRRGRRALQFVRDRGEHARGADPGARGRQRRDPAEHLAELELTVAAGAQHREHPVHPVGEPQARGQHHRVAQRAPEPRLVAGGDRIPADVGVDDEIAAEPIGGRADPVRGAARALGDVDQHRRRAQVGGDVGLREADPLRGRRVGPREHGVATERLAAGDLDRRARPGHRVDRQSLPGDAAEHERRPELLAAPRDRERADHVTSAADPEDQCAPRLGDAFFDWSRGYG